MGGSGGMRFCPEGSARPSGSNDSTARWPCFEPAPTRRQSTPFAPGSVSPRCWRALNPVVTLFDRAFGDIGARDTGLYE